MSRNHDHRFGALRRRHVDRWEAGVWRLLRHRFQPDLIVGASAGAWVGWAIASGCEPEELIGHWLDPRIGGLMRFGIHSTGIFRPEALFEQAQDLFERPARTSNQAPRGAV